MSELERSASERHCGPAPKLSHSGEAEGEPKFPGEAEGEPKFPGEAEGEPKFPSKAEGEPQASSQHEPNQARPRP